MNKRDLLLGSLAVFTAGLLSGIYLQHRWPVGRWGEDRGPAPITPEKNLASIAALPSERRLVILIAGQSNAANYGSTRSSAGEGVYAYDTGRLVIAQDPMPGADQFRGSPWPRFGAALKLKTNYDAVVMASIAQGGTQAADWAPGGQLHEKLKQTLHSLKAAGLPANFIFWQQGETEAWNPRASGTAYLQNLQSLIDTTKAIEPDCRWVIARATYGADFAINAQIREAHRQAGQLPGAAPGPDIDALTQNYRSDGIHLNSAGLDAAARLWLESIMPLLPPGSLR